MGLQYKLAECPFSSAAPHNTYSTKTVGTHKPQQHIRSHAPIACRRQTHRLEALRHAAAKGGARRHRSKVPTRCAAAKIEPGCATKIEPCCRPMILLQHG